MKIHYFLFSNSLSFLIFLDLGFLSLSLPPSLFLGRELPPSLFLSLSRSRTPSLSLSLSPSLPLSLSLSLSSDDASDSPSLFAVIRTEVIMFVYMGELKTVLGLKAVWGAE